MASPSALQTVNAELRKVTTGTNVKCDLEAVMQPHLNWESFLVPAPTCVSLLGEMIIVSAAAQDFSLSDRPPEGGFKLLKWPKSFKASLAQVSHSGYDAFLLAHGNMDRIRLQTANVPTHFKQALRILYSVSGTANSIRGAACKKVQFPFLTF